MIFDSRTYILSTSSSSARLTFSAKNETRRAVDLEQPPKMIENLSKMSATSVTKLAMFETFWQQIFHTNVAQIGHF